MKWNSVFVIIRQDSCRNFIFVIKFMLEESDLKCLTGLVFDFVSAVRLRGLWGMAMATLHTTWTASHARPVVPSPRSTRKSVPTTPGPVYQRKCQSFIQNIQTPAVVSLGFLFTSKMNLSAFGAQVNIRFFS